MSGSMIVILVLVAFVLPTIGAAVGRLMSRRIGAFAASALTLLGFVGSAGCVVLLLSSGAEISATSRWASILPGTEPMLQSLSFASADEPVQQPGQLAIASAPLVMPEPEAAGAAVEPATATQPAVVVVDELPSATIVTAPSQPVPTYYVVQSGDTLRSIAEQLGVSVQALLDANDLSPDAGDQLGVGQELRIPDAVAADTVEPTATLEPTSTPIESSATPTQLVPTATEPPAPTAEPPTATSVPPTPTESPPPPTPEPVEPTPVPPTATRRPAAPTPRPEPPSSEVRTYIVKQGDTLRSIATQFGTSADVLQRYNGLTAAQADSLQLGQRLYIPPNAPRPTAVVRRYVVKQGDTLRGIAAEFDVTVDALLRFNGLSPAEGDQIRPGQTLLIPES